ncbi:unnamed protein product [Clonostachys byssicola]|uniref:Xylanolytic transcriptional activator regulatory domain-containing protein n=1 Tax=Clonostachys byssicola TaxID=160290 RepID=A0A9N9UGJ9_9HYPO|nr:unnamed protein product [Clonostachys byssicola]
MLHGIEGSEDSIVALLSGSRAVSSLASRDGSESMIDSLSDIWRSSRALKELERLLADAEPGEDEDFTPKELHDRLEHVFTTNVAISTGGIADSPSIPAPSDETSTLVNTLSDILDAGATDILVDSVGGSTDTQSFQHIHSPVLIPADWPQLLNIYFSETQLWFPIVRKHDAIRQAYCIAQNKSYSHDGDCPISLGERASIFSLLAYASHYRSRRPLGPNPEITHVYSEQTGSLIKEAMAALERSAALSKYDSGHVQALLTLSMLQLCQGATQTAWTTVGRAVYLSTLLGIAPTSQATPPASLGDKERRLALGLFVLETLIASHLGQRPYLGRSDLERMGRLHLDDIEEWETTCPPDTICGTTYAPGRIASTFNSFTELISILNDHAHGVIRSSEATLSFQTWYNGLPEWAQHATRESSPSDTKSSIQFVNLVMAAVSIDLLFQARALNGAEASSGLPAQHAHNSISFVARQIASHLQPRIFPFAQIYLQMLVIPENTSSFSRHQSYLQELTRLIYVLTGLVQRSGSKQDQQQMEGRTMNEAPAQASVSMLYKTGDLDSEQPADNLNDNTLFNDFAYFTTTINSPQHDTFFQNLGIAPGATPVEFRGTLDP